MRARRNQPIVGLGHCLMEIRVFHVASVDKETLMYALFPCSLRFCHKTSDATERCFDADRQQVLTITTTIDIDDALA